MRRRFVNRIEVWLNDATSDGFGGYTNTSERIASSWCKVTTIPRDKLTLYGLDTARYAITIELRYREDLDYKQEGLYFVYNGRKFNPTSITPIDVENEYLRIEATFTENAEVPDIPIIETFDLTFDTTFR